MYILLFKPIPKENIFKIFKWIIMLFTWSKYNHIGHYYKGDVYEAKSPKYRKVKLKTCFKQANSIIHAFKVIVPIDEAILTQTHARLVGKKYDAKGAIYSEGEKWKWSNFLFKTKKGDGKIFCSEGEIIVMQDQGYFPKDKNPNLYSPQEVLERFIKRGIISKDYEVWK